MAQKEKKGPMTALWMGLGLILVVAVIMVFAYRAIFPADDSRDPMGGAKIKSQEIWSADGLTVTASEIGKYVERSWDRDAVYLKVKNDGSSPKVLRCTALSVNGAAVQPELLLEAQPGAATDGKLLFDRMSLYDMQIIHVGEISLELAAYDPVSGSETARSGRITLKTNKAKKAETPSFMYKTEALCDTNGIRISAADLSVAYSDASSALRLYVENTSGTDIRVVPADIKVNGKTYEVKRKNADGSVYDTRGVGEGYTFPAATNGSFYYELEWEPLEDVLPLDNVTGTFKILDNKNGQSIAEEPFEYKYQ